jgi:hypothetical protein
MQAVGFKRFPVWSLVGGYVVARRRSSARLLTAHALVAIGAMAVAAGTFDWLASNDHARTGTKAKAVAASTALLAILYRWRPFCLYLPILSQSKKTCTTMILRTMVQFRLDEVNHDQAVIAHAVIPFHLFHYRPGQ